MADAKQSVVDQALALSVAERREVIDRLEESMPIYDDPETQKAFEAELDRRITAIDNGETKLIPWEEVRANLQAMLDAARSQV